MIKEDKYKNNQKLKLFRNIIRYPYLFKNLYDFVNIKTVKLYGYTNDDFLKVVKDKITFRITQLFLYCTKK